VNHTRSGNGTGINHRIERAPRVGTEADGIERVPTRFDADFAYNSVFAVIFEGEAIGKWF
jgi:hypothetical protein